MSSNETTKEFLNAQYNVADMSLQLKMLIWRAAKAKYMVRLLQQCIESMPSTLNQYELKDSSYIMMNKFQNFTTGLIYGLIFIRYPRLSTIVPYNDDDRFAINGCLFILNITTHFQVN